MLSVKDIFENIYKDKELKDAFYTIYALRETHNYDFPRTAVSQYERYLQINKYLDRCFETILDTVPAESNDIVFVFKYIGGDFDDNIFSEDETYDSSLIHYNDLQSADYENFSVNNYESGYNLVGYGYEFCEFNEILGYRIAQSSIKEYGILECALNIFTELTFNGVSEETRRERLDSLKQSVDELEEIIKLPEEEQKNHFVSSDEVMADLRQSLYQDMSPDEKRYHQIKDATQEELRKNQELKDIEKRQMIHCMEVNQSEKRKIVKAELKRLFRYLDQSQNHY